MSKNSVRAIELTAINASTFNSTYLPINPNGLDKACSIIKIDNDTDREILISYDGTTDHDYARAGDILWLPFQANSDPNGNVSKMAEGTVVYVVGIAGGSGIVYLSGYYQPMQ